MLGFRLQVAFDGAQASVGNGIPVAAKVGESLSQLFGCLGVGAGGRDRAGAEVQSLHWRRKSCSVGAAAELHDKGETRHADCEEDCGQKEGA